MCPMVIMCKYLQQACMHAEVSAAYVWLLWPAAALPGVQFTPCMRGCRRQLWDRRRAGPASTAPKATGSSTQDCGTSEHEE